MKRISLQKNHKEVIKKYVEPVKIDSAVLTDALNIEELPLIFILNI